MRWPQIFLTLILLVGCDREKPSPGHKTGDIEPVLNRSISDAEAMDDGEAERSERIVESAEHIWESLDAALEMTDFDWISEAYIVEKLHGEGIKLQQSLYGQPPDHLADSIGSWSPPGRYIVIVISGRDKFARDIVSNYRISFPLSNDNKSFYSLKSGHQMAVADLVDRLKNKNRQQGVAPESATRSELESEDIDNPQPESKPRSR